jgi:hypothetical protein
MVPIRFRATVSAAASEGQVITNTATITDTSMVIGHDVWAAVQVPYGIVIADVALGLVTAGDIYTDTLVVFRADIAPDGADKPYSYAVDYGDGTTPVMGTSHDDPLSLGHIFATTGTYTVQVEVWNYGMTVPVSDTLQIEVLALKVKLYMPFVQKDYP